MRSFIFKDFLIRAILDGSKTMTRRPVKYEYPFYGSPRSWKPYDCEKGFGFESEDEFIKCPYNINEIVYARETWADVNTPDGPAICYREDGSYQSWHDFCVEKGKDYGAGPSMNYGKYPGEYSMWLEDLLNRDIHKEAGYRWKPSIHMPEWASRIFLKITDIKVERLQEISQHDAINEGIEGIMSHTTRYIGHNNITYQTPYSAFKSIWISVYGQESWDKNPWLWCYSFEKVDRPK